VRKDQRAAGELYVRGLLADGRCKSMQPVVARLGADHQRLQQFITCSNWDYTVVRRNVARDFAARQPVEALAADDTGFPRDGTLRRVWPGSLRHAGQDRQLPDRGECAPGERALYAADWRLFRPQSWDDASLAGPVAGARAARQRERAGLPGQVRHTALLAAGRMATQL
jgi:hypothetical protein